MGRKKVGSNTTQKSKNPRNERSGSICENDDINPIPVTFARRSGRTLTWDSYLESLANLTKIPPVSYFHRVPGRSIWDEIAVPGIIIELRNPFAECKTDVFWIATVVYFAGYFALVEFETFETGPSRLSWISFLSDIPHPLGWCIANGKMLHPGKAIAKSHPDYLEKMEMFIQGKPTISSNHVDTYTREIISMVKFNFAVPVEAADFSDLTCNRVGRITALCGDRFHVQYLDATKDEDGKWFTSKSDSVHSLGWSGTIGQELVGLSPELPLPSLPPNSFPSYPPELRIREGMCLETRHPEYPHKIVGARITKVLKLGYFIMETCDSCYSDRIEFCSHVTNPYIFPTGWASRWRINCENCLSGTMWGREFLRLELLPKRLPHHFQVGMLIEAMDITQLSFCGPATILKVAEHLLLIHFNNWSREIESNSLWMDAEFGDIYPIGYSELIGLEFQGHV